MSQEESIDIEEEERRKKEEEIEEYIKTKYFPPVYEVCNSAIGHSGGVVMPTESQASEISIAPLSHTHKDVIRKDIDNTVRADNIFVLENVLTPGTV